MKAPRGCLPAALLAFLLTPQGAAQASPAAPRHTTVTVSASRLLSPPTLDRPPPGYRMSANEAIAIASRLSKVIAVRRGRRPT